MPKSLLFNSFGSLPNSGIAGSHGNSMFNVLRNCQLLSLGLGHADGCVRVFMEQHGALQGHREAREAWWGVKPCVVEIADSVQTPGYSNILLQFHVNVPECITRFSAHAGTER